MGTTGGVEAIVGNEEALDRLAIHDVRLDDLIDILSGNPAVPNGIRINNDGWTVFALVQASRHICPHSFSESPERQLLFEEELQFGLAGRIAAAAWMSRLTLVAADEKMLLELGHEFQCNDFRGSSLGLLFTTETQRHRETQKVF